MDDQPGIIHDAGRNRDLFLVIVEAVTAADHDPVFEDSRTPGKTELRPNIILLRRPGVSLVNHKASQESSAGPGGGHKHIVLFRRERAEVRPAEAKIEGQVRSDFEIVLSEEADDVGAVVLPQSSWETIDRIEIRIFGMGRIVEEVPNVEKGIVWHTATRTLLEVEQSRNFTAKLDGVVSDNLGGHILVSVSPLVQDAADIRSKLTDVCAVGEAADLSNGIGGKSNRRLRIVGDFIPAPSRSVYPKFVEEAGREGVVPERRVGVVDLLVMEQVVVAGGAVQGSRRLWNPVDGKGDAIGGVEIRIRAAVVLLLRVSGVAGGDVVRNVGDAVEAAA